MKAWFCRRIERVHRGEKGITGLETAIILIAFVTVAAVLAYSVLSAGIFSSERGKEAVYRGLDAAQATMKVTSNVYCTGNTTSSTAKVVSFQLSSVLQGDDVDLGRCVVNYQDDGNVSMNLNVTITGSVTGLTGLLEPNEVTAVTVDLTNFALVAYDTFTLEIIPPTGATIQIKRTLPGAIESVMNLY